MEFEKENYMNRIELENGFVLFSTILTFFMGGVASYIIFVLY